MCFIYDDFSPGTLILTVVDNATLGINSLPGSAELCRDLSSSPLPPLTFLSLLSLENYV